MNSNTREIFKIFDEASFALSRKGAEIDSKRINHLLSNLYSPGPSFQYIFDFATRDFIYISSSVKDVLGVHHDSFNTEDFMGRIHPDDMEHFLHCQELASYFMFIHIEEEQLPHYKLSYQYRFRNKQGNYELFLHQAIASSWDDDFKMTSSIANHSNISHITNVNNYKISFLNILGGKSYYGISEIRDLTDYSPDKKKISKKEFEILNLIAEGFRSKEIASYLNISDNTVATHRRNILKKTNFTTIPQAITYFVREGLI